jgi:hypothetical protein
MSLQTTILTRNNTAFLPLLGLSPGTFFSSCLYRSVQASIITILCYFAFDFALLRLHFNGQIIRNSTCAWRITYSTSPNTSSRLSVNLDLPVNHLKLTIIPHYDTDYLGTRPLPLPIPSFIFLKPTAGCSDQVSRYLSLEDRVDGRWAVSQIEGGRRYWRKGVDFK